MSDLIAVAYAESGCYPLAKSPVGAEGLWQFIPDAARAYHLRIIDGTGAAPVEDGGQARIADSRKPGDEVVVPAVVVERLDLGQQ